MPVFKVYKNNNYTVMSNYHFKERKMSLKAKGLLSLMLSLPDDWDYSIGGLVAICKENETAIKSAIAELKEFGYVELIKLTPDKTVSGRFEYIYNIYETPKQNCKNQDVENLPLENLQVETHPLYKNTNNKNTNNKEECKEEKNSYQKVVELFNETCVSLPRVTKLTDKRKKAIKSILKNHSLEELKNIFKKVEESSFLNGSSGKWDGASFDWLTKESNIIKVIEGNYDDKGKYNNFHSTPNYSIEEYEKIDLSDYLNQFNE